MIMKINFSKQKIKKLETQILCQRVLKACLWYPAFFNTEKELTETLDCVDELFNRYVNNKLTGFEDKHSASIILKDPDIDKHLIKFRDTLREIQKEKGEKIR